MKGEEKLPIIDDKEADAGKRNHYLGKLKGISAAVGLVIMYVLSGTAVQLLERRIPDLELNSFRMGGPLVAACLYILITRDWPVIPRQEIWVTVAYTITTFISGFFYFVSISFLPASTVSCTSATARILSTLFLFSLCWDEKLTISKLLFALLSVAGVAMAIQPWKDISENILGANNGNLTFSNRSTQDEGIAVPHRESFNVVMDLIIAYSFAVITG